MKPREYEDLDLHPCVNDNREEADAENVEELEKFKQPHLDVRPWEEKMSLLESTLRPTIHLDGRCLSEWIPILRNCFYHQRQSKGSHHLKKSGIL